MIEAEKWFDIKDLKLNTKKTNHLLGTIDDILDNNLKIFTTQALILHLYLLYKIQESYLYITSPLPSKHYALLSFYILLGRPILLSFLPVIFYSKHIPMSA